MFCMNPIAVGQGRIFYRFIQGYFSLLKIKTFKAFLFIEIKKICINIIWKNKLTNDLIVANSINH